MITDPGARYDAEGVSGILNVITKGAEFEGYSANLNTTLMSRFQLVGGYTTIKYGKFSLSANYSFSHYISKIKSDSYREQFNNPDETYLTQHFDLRSKTPAHYGGLEASFEIDSLNLITLSGFLNDGRNKTTYFNRYGMESSAYNPVYSYGNDIDNHDNWGYSSVKADYQRSFKRNKKEMLTLSYQYGYSPNNMNSFSKITGKEGDSPSLQYLDNYNHQWNKARGTEHTLQLDYVNPFTQKHSVEGGMKYIRRSNSSRAISEIKSGEEEAWRPSGYQPFLTYEHLQNIMAAYAGYTFNNKKWGLNSGIRMEHTWQDVDYKEGQGLDFDYQATDWVPSLSGSFKISDHQNLRLSYNLRLRRPGINYLNPYVKISGSSISYGNPDLESEKHHRITLAYSYFASKFNFQASLLYSTSSGGIGNYQFLDEKNVLNSTYGNIEMSKGGGISTYIGYNPSAKTTLSVNASLYYLDMSLAKEYKDLLQGLSNNGINGGIYTNFSQKFNYGWRLALSGGCGKQEITLGYYPEIFYYYGTSVSKSFGGEKLTVSLRAQNFLQPYTKTTSKQVYPDFHLKQNVRYYDNAFGITVSYRFGELKESVRKASRSIANDDLMKSE
ncbi:MAG: outer membrane beta-barrel family protein [Parabacteroides sp.]